MTTPRAVELCDWLASVTLPDGGLPFALPVPDPAACAPFWAGADSTPLLAADHRGRRGRRRRVAAAGPAVAGHRGWPGPRSSAWRPSTWTRAPRHGAGVRGAVPRRRCRPTARGRGPPRPARPHVPADGVLRVTAAPRTSSCARSTSPRRPAARRGAVRPGVVEAELERLAGVSSGRRRLAVDFASYSPRRRSSGGATATVRATTASSSDPDGKQQAGPRTAQAVDANLECPSDDTQRSPRRTQASGRDGRRPGADHRDREHRT